MSPARHNILPGFLVLAGFFVLNLFHPGRKTSPAWHYKKYTIRIVRRWHFLVSGSGGCLGLKPASSGADDKPGVAYSFWIPWIPGSGGC